jgi:hypothetical protein
MNGTLIYCLLTACLLPPHPISTSSNQSCCLLPPQSVFTSSNQSCSTEHEGEREECAARPNYFVSAKSTLRVHEPLLVSCKIFTLPNDRLQLVELTGTSCWAPESEAHVALWGKPENTHKSMQRTGERTEITVARRKHCRRVESTADTWKVMRSTL